MKKTRELERRIERLEEFRKNHGPILLYVQDKERAEFYAKYAGFYPYGCEPPGESVQIDHSTIIQIILEKLGLKMRLERKPKPGIKDEIILIPIEKKAGKEETDAKNK